MTEQSITFQGALDQLGVDNATNEASTTYKTAGVTHQELLRHTVAKEYNILGITPSEFIRLHGATTIDFQKLIEDFKKICRDFQQPLSMDRHSKAVEFCSRMLYEVGPQARQVRKKDGDKT